MPGMELGSAMCNASTLVLSVPWLWPQSKYFILSGLMLLFLQLHANDRWSNWKESHKIKIWVCILLFVFALRIYLVVLRGHPCMVSVTVSGVKIEPGLDLLQGQ